MLEKGSRRRRKAAKALAEPPTQADKAKLWRLGYDRVSHMIKYPGEEGGKKLNFLSSQRRS